MTATNDTADPLSRHRAWRAGLFYPKADLAGELLPAPGDLSVAIAAVAREHLGELIGRVEPMAGGTWHRLYRLWRSEKSSIVARVSLADFGTPDYPLLLDRWAAARLREVGLPAPEVLAVDLSRALCPFDVELLAAAPGVCLTHFDEDESALAPLLERLGAFLARVHQIETPGHGLLSPDDPEGTDASGAVTGWSAYIFNHLDRHLAVCREISAISGGEEDDIRRAFRCRESLLASAPARLLHGDPSSRNVFARDGGVSALIDWEDALSGDPLYEVAFWATFHPTHRHAAFLRGYQREASLGPDFTERFWLYYLRAALAKTVVRHNLGIADRPGHPPASWRIQRGLRALGVGQAFQPDSGPKSQAGKPDLRSIRELASRIRRHTLRMVHRASASHIGSCFSCADLLAVLYGGVMRYRPDDPAWAGRDRLLVSKGHAAAAVYAALAEAGFYPVSWLDRFCEDGTCFAGHVHHGVPGVEASTGSLGHGLSLGCGMALAAKVDGADRRVFVLLGDGECDEGAVWEAALFAPHHRLDNLVALVDHNRIQSFGRVTDVLNLEPFADKWRAFGWSVAEVDGHDHAAVLDTLRRAPREPGKPTAVLARTVKGKGVSFMEDQLSWHYRSPGDAELRQALAEIEATPCG